MTTSNLYVMQYTLTDLVAAVLRKLGVLAEGQSPSTKNTADTLMALNMVIALFKSYGMPLWARTSYTFTPAVNDGSYVMGIGKELNTPAPVKVLQVVRNQGSSNIDLDVISDDTFNQLPNSSGTPVQATYQPLIDSGVLRLWPIPTSTVDYTVTVTYQRPFQFLSASTDTLDLPEEWYLPLVYKTATILAPEWGVPVTDRQMLSAQAKDFIDEVLSMGGEDSSMFIQPSRQ
jgi:hypothetical protein